MTFVSPRSRSKDGTSSAETAGHSRANWKRCTLRAQLVFVWPTPSWTSDAATESVAAVTFNGVPLGRAASDDATAVRSEASEPPMQNAESPSPNFTSLNVPLRSDQPRGFSRHCYYGSAPGGPERCPQKQT